MTCDKLRAASEEYEEMLRRAARCKKAEAERDRLRKALEKASQRLYCDCSEDAVGDAIRIMGNALSGSERERETRCEEQKECRGFKIAPGGEYSGCDQSGGDCPTCGK